MTRHTITTSIEDYSPYLNALPKHVREMLRDDAYAIVEHFFSNDITDAKTTRKGVISYTRSPAAAVVHIKVSSSWNTYTIPIWQVLAIAVWDAEQFGTNIRVMDNVGEKVIWIECDHASKIMAIATYMYRDTIKTAMKQEYARDTLVDVLRKAALLYYTKQM